MEHLTKQQIVLLTLFVAFVASIATGIVTVALLDKAPQGVTQSINQIIERTIEKAVPVEVPSKNGTSQGTDDLTVSAIARGQQSLVRIYTNTGTKAFVGMGIVISSDGTIATDKSIYAQNQPYTAVLPTGKEVSLAIVSQNPNTPAVSDHGIAFFIPNNIPSGTTFTPATLASTTPKLGQTVISLTGEEKDIVAVGIVSSLDTAPSGEADAGQVRSIRTTLSNDSIVNGGPIVTLDGKVTGITVIAAGLPRNVYLPASVISSVLKQIKQ